MVRCGHFGVISNFKESITTAWRTSFVAVDRSFTLGGGHENGALRGADRSDVFMAPLWPLRAAVRTWLTGVNTTQHTAEQCVLCQPIPLCSSPK